MILSRDHIGVQSSTLFLFFIFFFFTQTNMSQLYSTIQYTSLDPQLENLVQVLRGSSSDADPQKYVFKPANIWVLKPLTNHQSPFLNKSRKIQTDSNHCIFLAFNQEPFKHSFIDSRNYPLTPHFSTATIGPCQTN